MLWQTHSPSTSVLLLLTCVHRCPVLQDALQSSGLAVYCIHRKAEGGAEGLWWHSWAGEWLICSPSGSCLFVTGWQTCLVHHIFSGCRILGAGIISYGGNLTRRGSLPFYKERKMTATKVININTGHCLVRMCSTVNSNVTLIPQARKIRKWAIWACFFPALDEAAALFFYSLHFEPGKLGILRDVGFGE